MLIIPFNINKQSHITPNKSEQFNTMDSEILILITTNVANSLSILACLLLLFSYTKTHKKTLALTMITVLTVSDFVFHIMVALFNWLALLSVNSIEYKILNIAIRFSIFWTCNIGLYLYRLLMMVEGRALIIQFRFSLVLLMALSCGLSFMYSFIFL